MAIHERELKLLNDSDSIRDIVAVRRLGDESKSWWELTIYLNGKKEGLLVVTMRNTPRTWSYFDTLHTFITKTCGNEKHIKVITGSYGEVPTDQIIKEQGLIKEPV